MEAQISTGQLLAPDQGALASFADRWIWVFITGMYFVIVLTGFIPDSLNKIAAVESGSRQPFPLIMHFHAVTMGAWISLLLAQSTLMAIGNRAWHFRLGLVSVVLVPLIVFGMVGIVSSGFATLASLPAGAIPAETLATAKFQVSNLVLPQIRTVLLFSVFVTWALLVRRKDSGMHKRLLLLATLLPLPAAYDRITWLPSTLPASPLSVDLYMLLLMLPMVVYDLVRLGRIHKAVVIFTGANIPFLAFTYLNWGSEVWLATAPRLFGIGSW